MPKKYCLAFLYCSSFALIFSGLPAEGEPLGIYRDGSTQTNISGGAQCTTDCTISGGSRAGDNLFHSFSEFSIPSKVTVTFADDGAANIFTRVSQKASYIDGNLAITGTGGANFFLLNPYGIIFGPEASLSSAGSFVASTADSIQFSDGVSFISGEAAPPLLTISTPVSFSFDRLSGAITNQSQIGSSNPASSLDASIGLQVSRGKTLAFISNGIFFDDGGLTAFDGQIVLGSVATSSDVFFTPDLNFGFEVGQSFQDIRFDNRSILNVSGNRGRISMSGRHIWMDDRAAIANLTEGTLVKGQIDIFADESLVIEGGIIAFSPLVDSASDGANLTISTRRLRLSEGAVISGGTIGSGNGGRLRIDASESIELSGANDIVPTLITTSTEGLGTGGDIEINTRRLSVLDGAQIQSVTYGSGKGGDVIVNAADSVDVGGTAVVGFRGEVASGILASSGVEGFPFQPTGDSGNLTINTSHLTIRDGASVSVNSLGRGNSGDVKVNARSVRLDNNAQMTAAAKFGNGGNLWLNNLETLVLRRGSSISSQAGAGNGQGDGGNISISSDFIVAGTLEDSDIVAKATEGRGGNIDVNAKGLYGIGPGPAVLNNGTNDIDASSEFGISGTTRINRLVSADDLELANLSEQPLQIAATVNDRCGANGNRFVVTARSGMPMLPTEPVEIRSVLVDLGEGTEGTKTGKRAAIPRRRSPQTGSLRSLLLQSDPAQIEADSWVIDKQGQVVLKATHAQLTGLSSVSNCTAS